MEERRYDFCTECRKKTKYELKKVPVKRMVREKSHTFWLTEAFCVECGGEMGVPGLLDRNAQEMDAQYREAEGIISRTDIEKLLKMYHIGKAPLSLALGFGEVTIGRYLAGQIPSKEYSDVMKNALSSTKSMETLLEENRKRVGESAYQKAMKAIQELNQVFSAVSPKLRMVISHLFSRMEEVTPLMLQKLLYYIQGIHQTLYGTDIFQERCEAWVHGPVYRNVYTLFKDFRYSPIEDERFSLLEECGNPLSDTEKEVIDLVVDTFGVYSGKTLESITHREEPWAEARKGYLDWEHSSQIISEESIRQYFETIHARFQIGTEDGIKRYIAYMLSR